MKIGICDTETTGLTLPSSAPLEKQPRIIELALAIRENGEIVKKYNWLINPGNLPLPAEITKITGIKTEDLVGKPSFKDLLPEIKQAFSNVDIFVSHNAPFDTSLLKFDLERSGCEDFPWPETIICSAQEMKAYFGYRPKVKNMYEHFTGNKTVQSHRALDDVLMLDEALLAAGFYEFL